MDLSTFGYIDFSPRSLCYLTLWFVLLSLTYHSDLFLRAEFALLSPHHVLLHLRSDHMTVPSSPAQVNVKP